MSTLPEFEIVLVVGPETERDSRQAKRAEYAAQIAALSEERQFRAYLSRTLALLKEFDEALDSCLRHQRALEPVRQLFHELFEKFSNVLDQIWVAVWEARVAPNVRWPRKNDEENARRNAHFPIVSSATDVANGVRGTHVAAVVQLDADLLAAVLAHQEFRCGDKTIGDVKRLAARKHKGVLSIASKVPKLALAANRAGEFNFTRLKVEQSSDLQFYRMTVAGRWVDTEGVAHPLPEDCLWITYWGEVAMLEVNGDVARFVHWTFQRVVAIVADFERLLPPLP